MAAILVAFAAAGCGVTRVAVHSVKPAEAKGVYRGSKVAVKDLEGARAASLSSALEVRLSQKSYGGDAYFKIVPPEDADFHIVGSIGEDTRRGYYNIAQTRCVRYDRGGYCAMYERFHTQCDTAESTVSSTLNLVNAKTKEVVFSRPYVRRAVLDSCDRGDAYAEALLKPSEVAIDAVASEFADSVAPTPYEMRVVVMDDWRYDFTDSQEEDFEKSLEYMKQGRFSQAEAILESLNQAIGGASYEVAYNLGVLKEAKGDLYGAKGLYERAEELSSKPRREISEGLSRVEASIKERKEVEDQSRR